MLQQDEADDYVISSGVSRRVRELVAAAFESVGLDWEEHVRVDPAFVRAARSGAARRRARRRRASGSAGSRETRFEDMIARDGRARPAPARRARRGGQRLAVAAHSSGDGALQSPRRPLRAKRTSQGSRRSGCGSYSSDLAR